MAPGYFRKRPGSTFIERSRFRRPISVTPSARDAAATFPSVSFKAAAISRLTVPSIARWSLPAERGPALFTLAGFRGVTSRSPFSARL